ncbi:hypothetical protein [Vibrio sp. AND4]|uniref:hypothetical protein n=1 Tax=Vibrio sp. AND4 TaxID=314289 RepID=UPI00015F1B64|nr:hypothetical protein [Vibrio sp. AND4]EDP57237.1 hypothetical protein AND4_04183 [Vibrio sp. AND4]
MLYPCNKETEEMTEAQLEAYYYGANSALEGGDDLPNKVFVNPSIDIADAYRKGHAAQKAAMANDSSII